MLLSSLSAGKCAAGAVQDSETSVARARSALACLLWPLSIVGKHRKMNDINSLRTAPGFKANSLAL